MTAPRELPTPLAPLPPPPQSITSAIFQPVVQPAPSRPPLSAPIQVNFPQVVNHRRIRPTVYDGSPNQITSDNRLLGLQDCWERI